MTSHVSFIYNFYVLSFLIKFNSMVLFKNPRIILIQKISLPFSSPNKFSRHVVVHLPDNMAFKNNLEAGRF